MRGRRLARGKRKAATNQQIVDDVRAIVGDEDFRWGSTLRGRLAEILDEADKGDTHE